VHSIQNTRMLVNTKIDTKPGAMQVISSSLQARKPLTPSHDAAKEDLKLALQEL